MNNLRRGLVLSGLLFAVGTGSSLLGGQYRDQYNRYPQQQVAGNILEQLPAGTRVRIRSLDANKYISIKTIDGRWRLVTDNVAKENPETEFEILRAGQEFGLKSLFIRNEGDKYNIVQPEALSGTVNVRSDGFGSLEKLRFIGALNSCQIQHIVSNKFMVRTQDGEIGIEGHVKAAPGHIARFAIEIAFLPNIAVK